MQGFKAYRFPHTVAAIDGWHIFIKVPVNDPKVYYCRKRRHLVLLQGTVDHSGIFVDVSIGNVGRDREAHVLQCSNLSDVMEAGVWDPDNPTINIGGVNVPPLILGDTACTIRRWLITQLSTEYTARRGTLWNTHLAILGHVVLPWCTASGQGREG